jgi:hypothetical protein
MPDQTSNSEPGVLRVAPASRARTRGRDAGRRRRRARAARLVVTGASTAALAVSLAALLAGARGGVAGTHRVHPTASATQNDLGAPLDEALPARCTGFELRRGGAWTHPGAQRFTGDAWCAIVATGVPEPHATRLAQAVGRGDAAATVRFSAAGIEGGGQRFSDRMDMSYGNGMSLGQTVGFAKGRVEPGMLYRSGDYWIAVPQACGNVTRLYPAVGPSTPLDTGHGAAPEHLPPSALIAPPATIPTVAPAPSSPPIERAIGPRTGPPAPALPGPGAPVALAPPPGMPTPADRVPTWGFHLPGGARLPGGFGAAATSLAPPASPVADGSLRGNDPMLRVAGLDLGSPSGIGPEGSRLDPGLSAGARSGVDPRDPRRDDDGEAGAATDIDRGAAARPAAPVATVAAPGTLGCVAAAVAAWLGMGRSRRPRRARLAVPRDARSPADA